MLKIFLYFSLLFTHSLSYDGFTRREVKFEENLTQKEALEIYNQIHKVQGLLLGGSQATNDQFPFVADVLSIWDTQPGSVCTGSIIASNIVITARECML